jgi:hypothetical protein
MAGIFVGIPLGEGKGRLPVARMRRFVRWLQRRWPALVCELQERTEALEVRGLTINPPWANIFTLTDFYTHEQLKQSEALDRRIRAYLDGNQVRYEYWPGTVEVGVSLKRAKADYMRRLRMFTEPLEAPEGAEPDAAADGGRDAGSS